MTHETLHLDGVCLDAGNDQVSGPGGTHRLTPMECRLLEVLMRHPGQVISRAFLMKTVWQTTYIEDTRTLEVHVCTLRKKIEQDPTQPKYLRTVRGIGYAFMVD